MTTGMEGSKRCMPTFNGSPSFFSMGIDEFNGGSPIAYRSLFTVFSFGVSNKKTASSSGFSIRIHPWLMALFVRLKACLLLVSCR